MRSPSWRFLAVAAALCVTGCSSAPDGYVEAPKVAAYFDKLAPGMGKADVEMVSVCRSDGHWATTVMFEDGNLYHYEYLPGPVALKLEFSSTRVQRRDNWEHGRNELDDCLGSRSRPTGSYRFEPSRASVHAYIYESIVVNRPFNAEVTDVLKDAAVAVQAAMKEHTKFTPMESSWGVKL